MARQIKRFGKWFALFVPIALLAVLLARPAGVHALTFSSPFWTNVSSNLECACAHECEACGGPSVVSPEGVFYTSGAFRHTVPLLDNPGMTGPLVLSLAWRSDVSGHSQFGRGWIPSWEHTVRKVVLLTANPELPNGHKAIVNYPTGFVATFLWDGSQYVPMSCGVTDTLSRPAGTSGPYRLTFKLGSRVDFTAAGLPDALVDANGNTVDLTYNASKQVTALQDDRGFVYEFTQNSGGFVSQLDNPTHRVWTFAYDSAGNLTSIVTPASHDQTSGVTYAFAYDSGNRLASIKDGRGNTVKTIAYVGATYKVSGVTLDGHAVGYAYAGPVVSRTDRLGQIHRTHVAGNKIIQTDLWNAGSAQFVHTYNYGSGDRLAYEVLPRGNRIDYTWSGSDLVERRHRTANTSTNDPSDVVHAWTYANGFVASYTDPEGNQTAITRDSAGNPTQITFATVTNPTTQNASRALTYNSFGQVTAVTDEEGTVTARSYYASGDDAHLLESVTVDPLGLALTTSYGYDEWWNVDTVTDPGGHTTTITGDALRRRIEVAGPGDLVKVKYEYDADGRVTKKEVQNRDQDNAVVTANEWFTTTYAYGTLGDLTSVTEEIDASTTRTTTFEYDAAQNRIRVIKPAGNKVKYEYDERGLLWKVTQGETSSAAATTVNGYDDNGNLVETEDGRGNSTTFTFDLFDRRTRETDALGNYTAWALDRNGHVTEEARKDASDVTLLRRSSYFDERGRLWKLSDLRQDPGSTYADAVTVLQRTKTGQVATSTDARSKVTTFTYDAAGRCTKVTDPAGNERSSTLDADGNVTAWSVKDEDGSSDVTHQYEATYDGLNRRITAVEVDRTNSSNRLTTTSGYDSRGNLVWRVDAAGNPTRWLYDGLSRMLQREVALTVGSPSTNFTTAITAQWAFDADDRLISHEDDAQNTTTWDYDALDRAITLTYPDATAVVTTYDANGNVTQTIDAAGNDVDDTYDAANRRTTRGVTLASGFLDTTSETFAYDAANRLTSAQDDDYKVQFTYAALGLASQVYEEKQSYATGTAYLKTVTRTWDEVGHKSTEAYPSGLGLIYAWNDAGRLASISDGAGPLAAWTYAGTRPKQVDYQNGTKTLSSYSGFRGEVTSIHHKDGADATLLRLDYGYDANHDRLYERYGGPGAAGDAFAYDKARRLATAWMGSLTPPTPTTGSYVAKIEYQLDDDGNRTAVVTTPYGGSAGSTTYSTNALNQATAVGGTSRTHDANGNVTDDGTYLFEHNYKNLIVRAKLKSTGATVGEYRYDALGRRVEKTVPGATYRYVYSDAETVCVYTSTGTWRQDLVYDAGIDGIVMLQQADVLDQDGDSDTSEVTRSFFHRNALGSVMAITDMNQAVAVSYRYDAFGNVAITRNGTSQTSDPLGQYVTYTGRWRDEETGLYHYRARAFGPLVGRFAQRDPLGYAPDPNLYQYCLNSPANYVDPFGEDFWGTLGEAIADAVDRFWDRIAYVVGKACGSRCFCKCIFTAKFSSGGSFVWIGSPVFDRPPDKRMSKCTCGDHATCQSGCEGAHVVGNATSQFAEMLRRRDQRPDKSRPHTEQTPRNGEERNREPNPHDDSDWVDQEFPEGMVTSVSIEGRCEYARH